MSQNLAIKFASREFVVNRGTLNEGHIFWRNCGQYCISWYIKQVDKGKNNAVRGSQIIKLSFRAIIIVRAKGSLWGMANTEAYVGFVIFLQCCFYQRKNNHKNASLLVAAEVPELITCCCTKNTSPVSVSASLLLTFHKSVKFNGYINLLE